MFARVFAHAMETFGSADKAWDWLHACNMGLGGVSPLSLLRTRSGVRLVRAALVRIDHGVF